MANSKGLSSALEGQYVLYNDHNQQQEIAAWHHFILLTFRFRVGYQKQQMTRGHKQEQEMPGIPVPLGTTKAVKSSGAW